MRLLGEEAQAHFIEKIAVGIGEVYSGRAPSPGPGWKVACESVRHHVMLRQRVCQGAGVHGVGEKTRRTGRGLTLRPPSRNGKGEPGLLICQLIRPVCKL
jgi:hypothetical protein